MLRSRPLYPTILLLIFIAYTNGVFAQVYVKARSLTLEQGLSDNRVTCFYQDKAGFMWIGTRNGLSRYDGYRIITFRPAAGNSISNEIIHDIAEDSRGRIWVATMNGLNVYDPVLNHWEVFLPKAELANDDIPSNLIWDIHIDKDDRVWIASDVREFCFYDINAKKFSYFDWPAFVSKNPRFANGNYNSIKRFVFKNENEIFLASNKALVSLNVRTRTFRFLAGNYRSDVNDLRYDANEGKLYWVIENDKLLTWEEEHSRFTETLPTADPYPSLRFQLRADREIWLASETGLLRADPLTNRIYLSLHVPQITGSLQPGGVAAVLQTGSINWVGTSNGISIYDQQHQSSIFLPLLQVSDKESSNEMGGVFYHEKTENYFVCAADASVVFLISKETGEIKKLTADGDGNPFFHCNTVKEDGDGKIWLLTDNHVYWFDENHQQFQLFTTPNKDDVVVFRDMVKDGNGNYWFGSFHKGLYYYQASTKSFSEPAGKRLVHIQTTTALHTDQSKKKIWIGTFSRGLYCYDIDRETIIEFAETADHPEFRSLDLVQDITQDATGAVWVATQSGGLFRFRELKNGQYEVKQVTIKNGLPDNSYLALAASNDSLIWALSGSGLYSVNTNGQLVSSIAKSDQFQFSSFVSDVRFPHKLYYKDGELLIGAGGGLLIRQTKTVSERVRIPVVITKVLVADSLLKGNFGSGQIELPYNKNTIRFEFASLYYGTGNYRVKCQLNGFDKTWVPADADLSKTYQNLAPGKYQFQISVMDEKGVGVGHTQSFLIVIKPPFWQRWWAIVLAALLVASGIYFLVKRRVNGVRKKAALQQQMTELEAKALRAQMNPHFIFNSLNAIQELVVTRDVDAAYDYLSKFSKLLRHVLNHSEKSLIPLVDELNMLTLYLELESLRFRRSFHYQVHVAEDIDTELVLIPPLLLQPFIENALWHGLMLKEGEKQVQISISQQNKTLTCEITDNGIGRKKASEIKSQKLGTSHFESMGLKLSQHRIELLSSNGKEGHVKIEDLYENDRAAGTRVKIMLPLIHT
ncbi:MAG: hypothetical protein EON98_00770 [Chitinophagaceae bacterium]|nr:MAG: hypothetical protein EON98_00770 [Chitinophagaceae bacterium]